MKWRDPAYLMQKLGSSSITVTATPNGLADAVIRDEFVTPYEVKMCASDLFSLFRAGRPITPQNFKNQLNDVTPVYYVQSQCDNMNSEFSCLRDDVPQGVEWASEALGKPYDAMNFWMGETAAVTSLHKDHYENVYIVIAGEKTFTLIPPTEFFTLDERPYPTAQYTPSNEALLFESSRKPQSWNITRVDPPSNTRWVSIPPRFLRDGKDQDLPPDFVARCRPMEVTLSAEDILYLPAMWFHRVEQTSEVLFSSDVNVPNLDCAIALNYWYDMEFDNRYSYFSFLRNIVAIEKHGRLEELPESDSLDGSED
ncbi:cupin-like domain-containing protein [Cladochytrium replicatum]|nr:cupin-like domain-containing protein [Cladochytrium replicatum]